MKKPIKFVLALSLALTSVFSVPMVAGNDGMFDNCVVAEASTCSHNYRHYSVCDPWSPYTIVSSSTGKVISAGQLRKTYTVCVNCGKKEFFRLEYK